MRIDVTGTGAITGAGRVASVVRAFGEIDIRARNAGVTLRRRGAPRHATRATHIVRENAV